MVRCCACALNPVVRCASLCKHGGVKPGHWVRNAVATSSASFGAPGLRMLQGLTYSRRWVEVQGGVLTYAKTSADLAAGTISVFALHELAWVSKEGDTKFVVSGG